MNGKVLLDTNAVIAVFARNPSALSLITKATECFVPSVVAGELYYGAFRSQAVAINFKRLESFFDSVTMLSCDVQTAVHYGRLKNELRIKGRPIPENDIWIASLSTQYQLTLISNDVHFDEVVNLSRTSWQ